jgi:hypothetical protein
VSKEKLNMIVTLSLSLSFCSVRDCYLCIRDAWVAAAVLGVVTSTKVSDERRPLSGYISDAPIMTESGV